MTKPTPDQLRANLDEAADNKGLPAAPTRGRRKHPEGWEPGVVWNGTEGNLTVRTTTRDPQWDDLLNEWGFPADKFEVIEPVQFRTWDMNMGEAGVERAVYYKAVIRSRADSRQDLEVLINDIKRYKKLKKEPLAGDASLIATWADWQMGADDYGGPEATKTRFLDSIGKVQDRYRDLRKSGVPLGQLIVPSLGDLGEGCAGFYPQQTYRVTLNNREQRRLVRSMALTALREWSNLAPRIIVPVVGGNHGEERNETNNSFTDFSDNKDVAMIEDAALVLAENPDRFGHISFILPNHELEVTIDAHGQILGFVHGHQIQKATGASVHMKAENWWKDQMKARRPIGEADILFGGHFHQFFMRSVGPRTYVGSPALHGGSQWWESVKGGGDAPGQLTLVVDSEGWSNLTVL